jgi:hypothetical protein
VFPVAFYEFLSEEYWVLAALRAPKKLSEPRFPIFVINLHERLSRISNFVTLCYVDFFDTDRVAKLPLNFYS